MRQFALAILIPSLLSLTISLLPSNEVEAHPAPRPAYATAFEIIVAVNELRASYGLPPYEENAILMTTAQAQADYMASTGTVTHSGPGGISLTQRLINAGYQMEGGFRAENILSASPNASGYDIVHSSYWADADHQNTMLSPNLTEIGAGVAVSGGRGYYVIDCARPAGASGNTTTTNAAPVTRLPSDLMSPVIVSTPRSDGAVYHEVKFGQTLWSIAIAYGTTIEQIKLLNKLGSNDIYPGQQLLIMIAGTLTPTTISATATPEKATATAASVDTVTPAATETSAPTEVPLAAARGGGVVVGAIILIALSAAGLGAWLGTRKPE